MKAEEVEGDEEKLRKVRRWSTKKTVRVTDAKDIDNLSGSKLKKPNTFRRLWDIGRTAKPDDGTDGFSKHWDHLRSHEGQQRNRVHLRMISSQR